LAGHLPYSFTCLEPSQSLEIGKSKEPNQEVSQSQKPNQEISQSLEYALSGGGGKRKKKRRLES